MEKPKLRIGNKEIRANTPTVGSWKRIVRFNNQFSEITDLHKNVEANDEIIEIIVECFNNKEVTPEAIEDNLSVDKLMSTFMYVTDWVGFLIGGKVSEMPKNAETAKR